MFKNRRTGLFVSFLYLIIVYLLFFIGCNKLYFLNFSYELLFIVTIFNIFVVLHFFVNIKMMYNFIYKKRYYIGIFILLFLVVFKYNGSSVELWSNYIEPEYQLPSHVIMGVPRLIRSDEWLVSTPVVLSQTTRFVNFSSINSLLSAKDNLVTLFPNLPSFDISMLSTPHAIGFLFLDRERAYSLYWYLPYFILFFSTFELFMILTKKNRLYSFAGAIMITLSPVVQWWQSAGIPGYGALAVVLFYYFINIKSWKKKLILSLFFGYSGFLYIMCLYPAWQVPYGYVYFILLLYIVFTNKNKIRKKDFLYLIPVLIVIILPMYFIFSDNYDVLTLINSTVYPGSRVSVGGGEWRTLFTYALDVFFPYRRGLANPCEISQYFSLFPIPTLLSLYIILKNKKGHSDWFLIMSCVLMIIFSIWELFVLPVIVSKLLLLSMSAEARVQSTMGYLSVIQIIYIMSNYEVVKSEKSLLNFKNLVIIIISFVSAFLTVKISNMVIKVSYPLYVDLYTSFICLIYCYIVFGLFIYNHKRSNFILCLLFILVTFISGIIVSPVNKGLSIMYDKPIAKYIRKMVDEDNNSVFIATDSSFILANYLVASGAKTVNTTNYVPNLDLYYKLDPELRYDHIYNRYHHLTVNLTNDKTNFSIIAPDSISLNINYDDLCITGADYIVSNNSNLSLYDRYEHVYGKYNTNIYKTNCKNS